MPPVVPATTVYSSNSSSTSSTGGGLSYSDSSSSTTSAGGSVYKSSSTIDIKRGEKGNNKLKKAAKARRESEREIIVTAKVKNLLTKKLVNALSDMKLPIQSMSNKVSNKSESKAT